MNKAELVEHVADELQMTKADAALALDAVIGGIVRAMIRGDDVRLVGFGTFAVSQRAAVTGRNPQTGKAIKIPASRTVRFRAGTALKAALNSAS